MKRSGVLLVALLGACATAPSAGEIANADYGVYPSGYQETVKNYMAASLFDPYTAVYENWRGPSRGYSGGNFVKTEFGYQVCVDINAKNRMGGYVGRKRYYFLIRNGAVVQDLGEYGARKLCNF